MLPDNFNFSLVNACGAVAVALVGGWMVTRLRRRQHQLPLPPGPPETSWLKGNGEEIPRTFVWLKYTEWNRKYGDIMHARAGSKHIIVVSSYEGLIDLFDSQGAQYSHRPRSMGWESLGFFRSTYDDRLRTFRRHMNVGFGKKAVAAYNESQTRDVHLFLQRLATNPNDFFGEAKWLFGRIIMRITYGYSVTSTNDPYIKLAEDALKSLVIGVMGNHPIDTYPFLRYLPAWFPGIGFKRLAQEAREISRRLANEPFDWTLKALNLGTATPSFISQLLELNEDKSDSIDDIKWSAATMYSGGVHNTIATLGNFIAAMVLYPEVARKAREEIDRVIGTERLPTISDRADLPYLECVLLETLRWHPVAPLGSPRSVHQDHGYKGYRIPAYSTIYCNIYAITRDERVFVDPENFIPERFSDDYTGPKPLNPRSFIFGAGRRLCPGNHIVDASIFLVIASIIATMDMGKARDDQGNEIEPVIARTGFQTNQVIPFKCTIKPRSERALRLIDSVVLFEQE
ncbi:cytochrome P450 family protein [Rhizoctonia solani AG-3 Rhs1AP]|uniref:Cytochrome P450 family protein n=1 Tax=Rhizoctonia solani AG-3 Rhs1AP TaxID=1086054 RepID=X8JDE6_9AGAM|nr:cytochrome P450 family protein [Rhizoctonia solani AG-3 Rhs1AP]